MDTTTPENAEDFVYVPTQGVLLLTNNEQVPDDSYSFTVAATLAAKGSVPVTLYDRSEETWGDSQHPDGPLEKGHELLADRKELAAQIAWFDAHRVVGQAWVATLPSISAVLSSLAQVDIDVIVVPADLDRNLFERALEGSSLAESLVEQISRHPGLDTVVVEVDENGSATQIRNG